MEEIYDSITSCRLFFEEQKGCDIGSRGTAELLYIDRQILNESKTRRKNLAIASIDFKKTEDIVPQSWIINCLKIYKISHEVINFIKKPWRSGEWNWQQEEEVWLKQRSKEMNFKETHDHRYYLELLWCYLTTYSEKAQPDTDLVDHKKSSIP